MPTVLESLILLTNAEDYYTKGFAMMHCASYLKETKLEGETLSKALSYLATVTHDTNEASDGYLTQDQKDLCSQAITDLIHFDSFYSSCRGPQERINPSLLIEEIKKHCQDTNFCYLPSGWRSSNTGHGVSTKITKIDENRYDIAFLNRGAGCQYHDQLGLSEEKIKYDYQSRVYRFDINSDSTKLFFHGFLSLVLGVYRDKECDEQDLYGLLALHGKLQKVPPNELRKVTPQRSGTCALTNSHIPTKDTLLVNAKLPIDTVKRYGFFNKLASIVTAYKHLIESEKKQVN